MAGRKLILRGFKNDSKSRNSDRHSNEYSGDIQNHESDSVAAGTELWPAMQQKQLNRHTAAIFGSSPLPQPYVDSHFLTIQSMNTWCAFWAIAHLLQVKCSFDKGINLFPQAHQPLALRPTAKQLSVPHLSYVDLLPFPRIRDRILELLSAETSIFNEATFCDDMMNGDWKIWGNSPWSPHAWELTEDFVQKWWFLLDEEMLESTNFWRVQRLEHALELPISKYVETGVNILEQGVELTI